MAAPIDNYSVASGLPIYGGKVSPSARPFSNTFATAPTYTDLGGTPTSAVDDGKVFVVQLHGSSGSNFQANGRQYRVPVSGAMAIPGASTYSASDLNFDSRSTYGFSLVHAYDAVAVPGGSHVLIRPIDKWFNDAGTLRESAHCGFVHTDGKMHLVSERRYDAMMTWADQNLPQYNHNCRVLAGYSMGGWGTASYGIRRYNMFAALYPDRPRWKHDNSTTNIAVPNFVSGFVSTAIASSPLLADEDGGGTLADYRDCIAYVSNPTNKVRWIGWCLGRQDGFATMQDSIDMMDALEASGRGYAFYWNNGGHGAGSSPNQITKSYQYGTFRRDQGYPLFTEFSRNQNPRVDIAGGRNINLTFRNVSETASSWSCEVTCLTMPTSSGTLFSGDALTSYSSTTTTVPLPLTESEIVGDYVGGTITIGGETRTITGYTGVNITNGSNIDSKRPGVITVSTPFSSAPTAGTAYSITRADVSCTVKVSPISEIYKGDKTPKLVTIPTGAQWVSVSFT